MVHDRYSYLIVGGGMAADAAAHGIREVDPDGTIGLISSEPDPPYKRPPLSKKLWQGKPLDSVWLGTDQLGVDLHLGRTGRLLDLQHKRVVDDRGTEHGFDKLLLATGVTPRRTIRRRSRRICREDDRTPDGRIERRPLRSTSGYGRSASREQ